MADQILVNTKLREFVERIMNDYIKEKDEEFKDNKLGDFVRNTAPHIVRQVAGLSDSEYEVKGSVGNGKWAMIPWLGIFNKRITDSATKGVYIIYILAKDGNTLYLTFNQGCTKLKEGKGKEEAINIMRKNALNLVKVLDSHGFNSDENIDLGENLSELGELYQKGTIFYKAYKHEALPSEEELKKDLKDMIEIYNQYIDEYIKEEHNLGVTTSQKNLAKLGENKDMRNTKKLGLNTILYGPPGTGKTYNTVRYAVSICEPDLDIESMKYDDVLAKFRELKDNGRIEFTTFHQSYGYEEFIEGIKPIMVSTSDGEYSKDVKYDIIPGVFKEFCTEAAKKIVETKGFDISDDASIWKVTIRSEVRQDCFDNNRVRIDWNFDTDGANGFVNDMVAGDIIISTYGNRKRINGIAVITDDEAYELKTEADKTTRDVKWLAKNIDLDITDINEGKILHRMTVARVPKMKISDIVELARKVNNNLAGTVIKDNKKPYVFIIDEINRGNISKIFGELITLIEETKRAGADEAMEVTLPYSGDTFSVPKNVYILGTMNTADRSIALMDTALRRRFDFIEMMPDTNVLKNIGADKVDGLDVAAMLDTINDRIKFLYDREHTIGHAFFTGLKDSPTVEKLATIFSKSVIPLLQEYFYEDYQKIQFVLGDNGKTNEAYKFIKDIDVVVKNIFKGSVDEVIDLPEEKYEINEEALKNIESYKEIM